MYPPPIFKVDDPETVGALLRQIGLGALVTHGDAGFEITHMPFVFDGEGALHGHMGDFNPQHHVGETRAVAIFQAAEAYVTPSFYPAKAIHGRVAPTWNYEILHVHGTLRWTTDPAWIRRHLEALTDRFEAGRDVPWKVDDAPAEFTDKLVARLVGAELLIERVEVRRKLSQNQKDPERLGVIAGLAASADLKDRRMADLMRSLEPDAG